MIRRPPRSTLLSLHDALPIWEYGIHAGCGSMAHGVRWAAPPDHGDLGAGAFGVRRPLRFLAYKLDRKSTRLNSSHSQISYAVFCLKKKKNNTSISVDHTNSTR